MFVHDWEIEINKEKSSQMISLSFIDGKCREYFGINKINSDKLPNAIEWKKQKQKQKQTKPFSPKLYEKKIY